MCVSIAFTISCWNIKVQRKGKTFTKKVHYVWCIQQSLLFHHWNFIIINLLHILQCPARHQSLDGIYMVMVRWSLLFIWSILDDFIHMVNAGMRNRSKRGRTPVVLLRSLLDKYPWERYESPYPLSYWLHSTTTVLLEGWI